MLCVDSRSVVIANHHRRVQRRDDGRAHVSDRTRPGPRLAGATHHRRQHVGLLRPTLAKCPPLAQDGQHLAKTAVLAAAAAIPHAVQLSAVPPAVARPAPLLLPPPPPVDTLQLAAARADWQAAGTTAVKWAAIFPWVNFADE